MDKKIKNFTINWFWLYRAFSYDFVFYYTVATLYYTTMKGFALSDVMLLHSITAISTFLLIIPISWLIRKIGNTLCVRIGTFLWILYMFATIFINNFYVILAIEVICSCGSVMKILSDSVIITNTLEKHNMADKYVKIESKGVTTYFFVDCIGAVIAGYLFNINAHIPMILCLAFIIFSFILSLGIKDETETYKGLKYLGDNLTEQQIEDIKNGNNLKPVQNNKIQNKYIGTKRFFLFLFFVIAFYSLIMSVGYMQTIGLVSIGVDAVKIGFIVVACKIVNSIASWCYGKFENKIKQKFPIIFTTYFMAITLLLGIVYTFIPQGSLQFWIVVVLLIMIECVKQPYRLFAKDHIRSHTSGDERQNFYTIYFMTEAIGDFVLCLLGSFLLESLSVGITYLLLLAVAIVPIIVSSVLFFKLSKKNN